MKHKLLMAGLSHCSELSEPRRQGETQRLERPRPVPAQDATVRTVRGSERIRAGRQEGGSVAPSAEGLQIGQARQCDDEGSRPRSATRTRRIWPLTTRRSRENDAPQSRAFVIAVQYSVPEPRPARF